MITLKALAHRAKTRKALAWQQEQQLQTARQEQQRQLQAAAHEQQRQAQAAEEERQKRQRYEMLVLRFGPEVAEAITGRHLWVGASEPMVLEMFGAPDDVEEKVLKTKTKRTLKYRDLVRDNRYALKVVIENGSVVGWEDKS